MKESLGFISFVREFQFLLLSLLAHSVFPIQEQNGTSLILVHLISTVMHFQKSDYVNHIC